MMPITHKTRLKESSVLKKYFLLVVKITANIIAVPNSKNLSKTQRVQAASCLTKSKYIYAISRDNIHIIKPIASNLISLNISIL